ncbi:flap endonuclease [Proteobacteria bacterium 005FR1]|nr:flap endonuclease [Proteobacteria bacterium 005FR1]
MMADEHPGFQSPVLLIDSSIYIFQYYFSLPDNWFSDEGYPTAAVYGFTTFLLKLLEEQQPQRIAACFDESLGSCFRNQIYPDYKSSRAHPDEALAFQLAACREIGEILGIRCFASREYEADDLIGTLCRKLNRSQAPVAILTRDKDLGQLLLRAQDYLWDYSKGERFYAGCIQNKFGVMPAQLVDYLALVGDSIDDIPGVPGLGPKTAQAILQVYPDLDAIFAALDKLHLLPVRGAQALAEKLTLHRDQIEIARQLARIVDKVPLEVKVADLSWRRKHVSMDYAAEFCERMGFPRLVARIERVLQKNSSQAIAL